jgi:hypothetical protein
MFGCLYTAEPSATFCIAEPVRAGEQQPKRGLLITLPLRVMLRPFVVTSLCVLI